MVISENRNDVHYIEDDVPGIGEKCTTSLSVLELCPRQLDSAACGCTHWRRVLAEMWSRAPSGGGLENALL